MKISITLVHNKGDKQNKAQIELLKPLIEKRSVAHDQYDKDYNLIGQFYTYYYSLIGMPEDVEVMLYQVIPYGVTPPPNLDEIDSHKVFYGPEDADVDETRFFNWGTSRGSQHGAEVAIYVKNVKQLKLGDLLPSLRKVADKNNKEDMVEATSVTAISTRLFKEIGDLDENEDVENALTKFKVELGNRQRKVIKVNDK